ncbi:MAG: DUF3048 domain-containing protein [Coriobacteriia bacterium]|nr:DUF3048 domain-containing protein [Coriobacteriia bacterium]
MKRHPVLFRSICVVVLLCAACGLAACKKKAPAQSPVVTSEPAAPAPAVWPLTGLPAPNDAVIKRRPLSVKIENIKAARPQTGVNRADIVYETMVEGGITRFNCLYDSDIPDTVGPVRSARLSDLWVVPQYKGLFFYSGSNSEVNKGLKPRNMTKLGYDSATSLYHRISERSAPHNLYLSLSKAYDKAKATKIKTSGSAPNPGPVFGELSSDETTAAATTITIPFASLSQVSWTWDSAHGQYLRANDGAPAVDMATGKQLWATNVVVMWATYTTAHALDPAGNPTYDITLGGTGKAAIFRNGLRIDGTWKADKNTPPVITDAAGKVIPLEPGRTWFEVPKTGVNVTNK